MKRRKFRREFKVEAIKLDMERGVSVAQAGRDLDVHENVLRSRVLFEVSMVLPPRRNFVEHCRGSQVIAVLLGNPRERRT